MGFNSAPKAFSQPEEISELEEVKGSELQVGDVVERSTGFAAIARFGNSGQDRVVILETKEQFEAEPDETFHILKRAA